jgi:O-antigen/teichoic acid export membrane protein
MVWPFIAISSGFSDAFDADRLGTSASIPPSRSMKHLRLPVNAVASIIEVVVSGLVLFFMLRFLIMNLGADLVGVWSLVLATTSLGRAVDFGISGALLRFVSVAQAQQRSIDTIAYVQTATFTMGVGFAALSLASYPVLLFGLHYLVPPQQVSAARHLLPYALLSFCLSTVASSVLMALSSLQRSYLKSAIAATSNLLLFALTVLWAPTWGLNGVAFAQVVQNVIALAVAWLCLRHYLPGLPLIPLRGQRDALHAMLSYGIKLQTTSIAWILFDPAAKVLMSLFGNLGAVAYYEMASRMVLQVRGLVVAANQVLVPAFADLNERGPQLLADLYGRANRITWVVAPPLTAALIACTPLISEIWIGRLEPAFISFAVILAVGWLVNVLSVPAFMLGLGTGRVTWNVWSQVLITVGSVACGSLLGERLGAIGVVSGVALSLSCGSVLVLERNHRLHGGQLRDLVSGKTALVGVSAAVAALVGFAADVEILPLAGTVATWSLVLALLALLMVWPLWRHPERHLIGDTLRSALGRTFWAMGEG